VIGTSRQTNTAGASLDLGSVTDSLLLPVGTTGQEPTCGGSLAGGYRYNSTTTATEFCNSSSWSQLLQVQSTPVIPAPVGSGYFVLTGTTYNGNLGGLTGANAQCLIELRTTNRGWQGFATALVQGQLISTKVFAFLCNNTTCNNLQASTTYYFANAGNPFAGGASFTTNASGLGPNDSADWGAANYFGGTYTFWSNRGAGTATAWPSTPFSGVSTCSSWGSSASGSFGELGMNANTTKNRWDLAQVYTCNDNLPLICFVNP
jgi:hypothetical protein